MAELPRTIHLCVDMQVPSISQEAANELTRELMGVLQRAVNHHMQQRKLATIGAIIEDIHIHHEVYLQWQDDEGRSE
jgi:hypothetical protein